ncbi:VanZ family protein [Emticicia agri]|uniref:VanZ family protein n=1 Tax=Emticicia agri TaxID=2492393 RepID=A0A4Q5M079_9BACT|nr:VanZ family protein [Emticicia agri]RYU95558.1 VanZ family protein [Emticicia agri]
MNSYICLFCLIAYCIFLCLKNSCSMNIKTFMNQFFTNKYVAFAVTIAILILCSLPSREVPLSTNINDKAAHFLAFGIWSFCWQASFGKYIQTILLGFLYGILIESWQGYILPESFHRSFDWYDAIADGIGVIIGVGLWKLKNLLNL